MTTTLPCTSTYLVYTVSRDAFGKVIGATTVGPVLNKQEEAEREVIDLKTKGWDASWVMLTEQSRWIVT